MLPFPQAHAWHCSVSILTDATTAVNSLCIGPGLKKQLKTAQKHTTKQDSALATLRAELTSITASKHDLEQQLQDKAHQLQQEQHTTAQQAEGLQQLEADHRQQTDALEQLKRDQQQQAETCIQLEGTVLQQADELRQLKSGSEQQAAVCSELQAGLASAGTREEALQCQVSGQQNELRTVQEQLAGTNFPCSRAFGLSLVCSPIQ